MLNQFTVFLKMIPVLELCEVDVKHAMQIEESANQDINI